MSIANQPISRVTWRNRRELKPNSYNPNSVAPPELDLLALSIVEDNWTQPIVTLPDGTIVDGFHRWTVSARPEVYALTGGMVPVVVIDADPAHRMMSTIRHNRARGTHAVLKMAEIVRSMVKNGLPKAEIMNRLGMDDEELDRLLDRAGMTVRGITKTTGFGKAWVPTNK